MSREDAAKLQAARSQQEKDEDESDDEEETEIDPDEDEKLGYKVKVAGIKQRPINEDSGEQSEEYDNELDNPMGDIIEDSEKSTVSPSNYYMWDEPLSSMRVTVASFKNNP